MKKITLTSIALLMSTQVMGQRYKVNNVRFE